MRILESLGCGKHVERREGESKFSVGEGLIGRSLFNGDAEIVEQIGRSNEAKEVTLCQP